MRTSAIGAVLAAASVLTACGSDYSVSKLPGTDYPRVLPQHGIYYSLPKTEVILRVPVTKTTETLGELTFQFEENVARCLAGNSPRSNPTPGPVVKFERGSIAIFTRPQPDENYRYRLDVTAETFSSFTHTVEVNELGLLTSADTKVSDGATAAALSIAKTVASIAKLATGLPTGGAAVAPVTCADILKTRATLDDLKAKIEVLEVKRADLLLDKALSTDPGTLQKALDYIDAQIKSIKENGKFTGQITTGGGTISFEMTYADALKKTGKKKDSQSIALFGIVEPQEFTASTDAVPDWQAVGLIPPSKKDDSAPSLPTLPGGTEAETLTILNAKGLVAEIQKWDIKVDITPKITYATGCGAFSGELSSTCLTDSGDGGYRYRIGARGDIRVKRSVNVSGVTQEVIMASAVAPIAQYGPIAQLPSKFGGIEGSVSLNVFTDTGALKKVTVGAKPQNPNVFSDFVGVGTQFIEQRRAAREAESDARLKKEEAAADEEFNALKREKETLELQKAIRDLKTALGIEEEQ